MEIVTNILTFAGIVLFCVISIGGSLLSMQERSGIKRGMREGENDYYGNKIEK